MSTSSSTNGTISRGVKRKTEDDAIIDPTTKRLATAASVAKAKDHLSVEQVKEYVAAGKRRSSADVVKYVRLAEEFGLTVDEVMDWEKKAKKHRLDLRVALVLVTATETW